MTTMTSEDFWRECKDYGSKAANALSAAAEDYGKYVEALGGHAASAEQKAQAMVQSLGRRIVAKGDVFNYRLGLLSNTGKGCTRWID